jgi:hypothetical protein
MRGADAMCLPPILWAFLSRFAGGVLLVSGSLKTVEAIHSTPTTVEVSFILVTAFELVLGVWLVLGFFPRWTRVFALGYFLLLLETALLRIVQGRQQCGCFGEVPVAPWKTAILDAFFILAFLFCPPSLFNDLSLRLRRTRRGVFAVSLAAVTAVMAWLYVSRGQVWAVEPAYHADVSGEAAQLAARVFEGLERNRAAMPTLVYTTQTRADQKQPTAKSSEPVPVIEHTSGRTVIRNDSIRQEWKSTYQAPDTGEIAKWDHLLVWHDGRLAEFLLVDPGPGINRQAWLRTVPREYAFRQTDDLRCAGLFAIPADLRGAKILEAKVVDDRLGRKAIRLRLQPTSHRITDDVTADFVESQNYLPSRVVYRRSPTGGIIYVVDVDYSKIEPPGVWFPKLVASRSYPLNATDPDAKENSGSSSRTVTSCVLGGKIADDEFDPVLPANCALEGNLASARKTGGVPIRASELTLPVPKPEVPIKGLIPKKSSWRFQGAPTFAVVALCLLFRKPLRF